ncbi:ABC1 family protein [Selenomonas sputigena ATCC 35185]|uniref:ABC1 family protein n=2 Tax=Selenomonas sputigena (strain ATCC 35185 / DSM 20758 / CCUG 44933 / VPI D19B-28) TaxID=546271 RepID=C9LUS4_SELS3|nr:ABC1 family protein [Selenomonas sputigena ATCC 35185]
MAMGALPRGDTMFAKAFREAWRKEDQGSATRLREMVEVLRARDIVHGITPEKLRLILEDLGPTFVKLGQIMSMRPDFLPQEYCDELMKLQTEANPLPFSVIEKVIEQEYQRRWTRIFRSIDEEALGSASIAQVHCAVLLDGEKVVIKVQRPGVHDIMSKDIVLLKRAAGILKILGPAQDVVDFSMVLDELWAIAKQEMDFVMEANHIEEFRHANQDADFVSCPKVYRHLTTQHVLVMEYVDGIQIDDVAGLKAAGIDARRIGERLGENYVKQIVEDGYFHADPHPGNIWVRGGKIVWLDLGMMGRLSNKDRAAIRKAIFALAQHDVFEMKAAVLSLGVPQERIDHARLYQDIDALIAQYGDLDFRSLKMGILSRQIMNVLRSHHIAIAPGISMFCRGVMTIEGVMRLVCPEVSFVEILARSMELSFAKGFNWREEAGKAKREGYILLRKSLQLPEQISDILKMTLSGQTKVNLELTGADEPLARLNKMINKLIIALLSAALLLGSSTICTTQMTPKIMEIPFLGVLGYLAAIVLSARLLWSILRGH